jgi:hypothetical protein
VPFGQKVGKLAETASGIAVGRMHGHFLPSGPNVRISLSRIAGCVVASGRGYYTPELRVDVPGRPRQGVAVLSRPADPGDMRNERLRALLLERGNPRQARRSRTC